MTFSELLLTASACACFSLTAFLNRDTVVRSSDPGKILYEQNCLSCHQADGSGVPNLAPPLIKGQFVGGDKRHLIRILLDGLQGVEINGEYYANPMPSFAHLTDNEIALVLTYVRTNFNNQAEEITEDEVRAVRAER